MDRLPTAADFNARRVTNPAQSEIIRQRFFDYQLYQTAGTTQLAFFQSPIGSGITTALGGTVGSPKTAWDTNLELGGTLPSGKAFMIESIEVLYFPGSVSTTNTYTPVSPVIFNATPAAALSAQLSDVNTFYQSGLLELNILSKNYLRETPLIAFPPKTAFNLDVSYGTGATSTNAAANMRAAGRPYYIDPTISLQPAVNFEVLLKFPSAVATPSGFNARVGVILDGYFMRASQ